MSISYILSDIEGTTTSVDFVYEVLFPYFKTHFRDFILLTENEKSVDENFALAEETMLEEDRKKPTKEEITEKLLYWVATDRKHMALKNLQGLVWQKGYERGELKGHIYADVPAALQQWQDKGIKLGIYSSGSVTAQKLIFGSSVFGDLTHFFSHYFDTSVGQKRSVDSYMEIQKQINVPASDILFLSDIEEELDAAKSAGYQTIQLVRENTKASLKHRTVQNFGEIKI